MRNKKKVSIKDIARLSGVSVATVSRVINHNGRFSEETRKRVEAVIEQYHYTTNMAGKSLRESKTNTIGVIVPDITNELFSQIVLELEKFFFEQGFSVLICNTNEETEKEIAYFRILEAKMVAGIVCISGREDLPQSAEEMGIPIVCIDRKPKGKTDVVYVESDHYLGGYIATETLIQKGCEKILILSKQKALSVNTQRLNGYLDALRHYRLPVREELIVPLDDDSSNFQEARDRIFYMVKKRVPFDGVFATNDWRAYGALVALQQNGIAVPQQVKIVGFDGTSVSEYCYPPITTIQQNKKELALQAAQILLRMIQGEPILQKHFVLPVALIERHTT
ncbi:LacI family DNA-binding transcriptional regulator [Massiliimalia timonensis]|uniref:LacI family DNA-binding transcriptional regulator n=1 Tax=Massiliimalia timonensis TaxID=1987501 RepID=UPI00189E9C7C|nr:LacI family DNA-binding transcriptional regulator [Massiliimalia timonensis]